MGAAARRKGFGFSRPAAFGGPLCGLPNAMLANQRFTLGEPRNPVFYCGHYLPTNASRLSVCHSVPIPDKLPHGNPEGTIRLQCRQGQQEYCRQILSCRHGCIHAVSTFLTGSTAEGEDTSFLSSLSSRSSPKYCAGAILKKWTKKERQGIIEENIGRKKKCQERKALVTRKNSRKPS